jgi:hypothetical protein
MEAVSFSEISVFTRLHGATSQKTSCYLSLFKPQMSSDIDAV